MRRSLSIILVLLCATMMAHGESRRVAVVNMSGDETLFFSRVSSLAESLEGRSVTPSEEEVAFRKQRERRKREREKWKSVREAYAGENEESAIPSLALEEEEREGEEKLSLLVKTIPFEGELLPIFREKMYDFFCDLYEYDALLLVSREMVAGHVRLLVSSYLRAENRVENIFDRLSFDGDYEDVMGPLRLAVVSSLLREDFGLVLFSSLPPSLSLAIDGEPVLLVDSSLVLPSGEHEVTMKAAGFETKTLTLTVKKDEEIPVSASLVPLPPSSLSLLSRSGNVTWKVDGKKVGGGSFLTLDNLRLPVLIEADKAGFAPLTRQLTEAGEIMEFDLAPAWAKSATIIKRKQRDFYTSFLSLIISSGLSLASSTLSLVYGENNPFSPVLTSAARGATVLTGLLLLRAMSEYAGSLLAFQPT